MKKIKLILVLISIAIFVSSPCYAQEWAIKYGGSDQQGSANSIQQTTDGGYVVAGSFEKDFWVLKLDASGGVTWQKRFRSKGNAYSIRQTADGGYIVAGSTRAFGVGSHDVWVLKLDGSGNVIWQKTWGKTLDDYGHSVRETIDGGYIVAGSTKYRDTDGHLHSNVWVLKLDEDGNIAWHKEYGGESGDGAYSVQQTTDGGYVVAGTTWSFGAGEDDVWVLKLEAGGDVTWEKTYGGIDSDYGRSIQQTTDGGYIVTGSYGTAPHDASAWILKLDAGGDVIWQKIYSSVAVYASSIRQTADGGYVVAGQTWSAKYNGDSDVWVCKINDHGEVVWQKEYGDSEGSYGESAGSIEQTGDGGYVVAGYDHSFDFGRNVWLLKLDTNGEIPDCGLCSAADATVSDSSVSGADTSAEVRDVSISAIDTSVSPEDTWAGRVVNCGQLSAPSIKKMFPLYGEYGIKTKIKGRQFGEQRTGMFGQEEGYYSFVSFSGAQTFIGTKYISWKDNAVKVRFKKLFVDEDGDFLQDVNEPFVPMEGLLLGDHALTVHTIRFEDLNASGTYDEGDNIVASESSNPVLFDEPIIFFLDPKTTKPSSPSNERKVKIIGLNFGDTQGSSKLHFGGKTWLEGKRKILSWRDDFIEFVVPVIDPPFPKYRDVWVTVFDGLGRKTHSNESRLRIFQ